MTNNRVVVRRLYRSFEYGKGPIRDNLPDCFVFGLTEEPIRLSEMANDPELLAKFQLSQVFSDSASAHHISPLLAKRVQHDGR